MPNYDIRYAYVSMPNSVKACVVPDSIGTGYTIVINSRLSEEGKVRAIKHELKHINCDDCFNEIEVTEQLENFDVN